jgi:hypothetical protein
MVIRTEIFHTAKSGPGGGIEAVEELIFPEQHGKIG